MDDEPYYKESDWHHLKANATQWRKDVKQTWHNENLDACVVHEDRMLTCTPNVNIGINISRVGLKDGW